MLLLLAQALIDVYAVSTSRYSGIETFRLITRSDVWDQLVLTLTVAGFFVAGALSYVTPGVLVIVVIVASAYLLIVLGFMKLIRRRRIFSAIRFDRKHQEAPQ
jgi:O-antigen/teichoic acid export membrane protein